MIKLNETAKFLWDLFVKGATREEGIAALEGEYSVSREEAERGVDSFIGTIVNNGIAEEG